MRIIKYSILSFTLFIFILNFACEIGTDPEPQITPLDGSGGGVIVYSRQLTTNVNGTNEIYAINADGTGNIRIIETDVRLDYPSWSPDAQKYLTVGYLSETIWSIYVFDTEDGGNLTRLTTTNGVWDNAPGWSKDGTQIAFSRFYQSQNREEIWIMNADGSDQHWIGIEGGSPKWSLDGTKLIYHSNKNNNYDLFTCNIDGEDEQPLTSTPSGELGPAWSPDFSQIAYTVVGDDLSHDIYVMNMDGTNIHQLTTDGSAPEWSLDGSLIAFHSDGEVFVINVDGTNRRQVTNSPSGYKAINPAWEQPRQNN